MKPFIIPALLVLCTHVFAQQNVIPKKEFSLSLSSESIEVKSGETKKIEMRLLKSSGYQKSKVQMGISSSLPKGVAISFNPDKGNFDTAEAIVTVSDEAAPGQYNLILNATVNYKTKGSILKLIIPDPQNVSH